MKERESLMDALSFVAKPVESYAKEGSRIYDVVRNGVVIGQVERFRDRYPYKSLGGNVAMFRSRWSWRHDKSRLRFDSRQEAARWLVDEVDRVD